MLQTWRGERRGRQGARRKFERNVAEDWLRACREKLLVWQR